MKIITFGHTWGVPDNADIVIDVRRLPDPGCTRELWRFDGRDRVVRKFLLEFPITRHMIRYYGDKLSIDPTKYRRVCVGCEGGVHRSVGFAILLRDFLRHKHDIRSTIEHLDVDEDHWVSTSKKKKKNAIGSGTVCADCGGDVIRVAGFVTHDDQFLDNHHIPFL